jgi:hypothetical protein
LFDKNQQEQKKLFFAFKGVANPLQKNIHARARAVACAGACGKI